MNHHLAEILKNPKGFMNVIQDKPLSEMPEYYNSILQEIHIIQYEKGDTISIPYVRSFPDRSCGIRRVREMILGYLQIMAPDSLLPDPVPQEPPAAPPKPPKPPKLLVEGERVKRARTIKVDRFPRDMSGYKLTINKRYAGQPNYHRATTRFHKSFQIILDNSPMTYPEYIRLGGRREFLMYEYDKRYVLIEKIEVVL